MYDMYEALGQVLTPGSKEQTTPRDTKFNQASRHPMAKSGLDETCFLMYLEEIEEGYAHTIIEFVENGTNFCQNNTLMSERKIKEWVQSSLARVLINKTHKFLTYMENLEDGYPHTIMEFEENGTNFCQNNTLMSEKKIKEWVQSGTAPGSLLTRRINFSFVC